MTVIKNLFYLYLVPLFMAAVCPFLWEGMKVNGEVLGTLGLLVAGFGGGLIVESLIVFFGLTLAVIFVKEPK